MKKNLWLKNRGFDFSFFHLAGILGQALLIPFLIWGPSVLPTIFILETAICGWTHNYLTWSILVPKESRRYISMFPFYFVALGSLVFIAVIPLARGTELASWALSLYFYVSVWHTYRQDHGICKVYDQVQMQRWEDSSLAKDRKWLNIFFAMASAIVLVNYCSDPIIFHIVAWDKQDYFRFIHPYISKSFFPFFFIATAIAGLMGVKQAIWDRYRKNKFIPWPQISLITISALSYWVPLYICRGTNVQLPFAYLVHDFYHTIQYWGFVWLTEEVRSKELLKSCAEPELAFPQRFAARGNWKGFFGAAFVYAACLLLVYRFTPQYIGLSFIFLVSFAHYVLDGYLWRRDTNMLLPAVLRNLSYT